MMLRMARQAKRERPPRVPQSKDDLWSRLAENGSFLFTSTREFDNGSPWEARRLAATIRTLCHDTGQSRSLLGLLNLKEKLHFAWSLPDEVYPERTPLVTPHFDYDPSGVFRVTWHPILEVRNDTLYFDEWWTGEIAFGPEVRMSRKKLVLDIANTDGGAHVDPTIDEMYANVARGLKGGVVFMGDGSGPEVLVEINPTLAAIRTVAHELIVTLDQVSGTFPQPSQSSKAT